MEENHKGKVWGGGRGGRGRSGERFLRSWGIERDWEAMRAL